VKPQSSPKPFELNKRSKNTIMEPLNLAKLGHIAISTRVQMRSLGSLEENEQQPPETIDIVEIPSPREIPLESTPILEEIL